MMRILIKLVVPALCLGVAACSAQETTNATKWLARDHALPVETSQSWELPAPPPGQRVLVRITSRREAEKFAGWNYLLQIKVNGRPVDACHNRMDGPILLNHALSFYRTKTGKYQFWNQGDGIWLVMFSPDFQPVRGHYGMNEDDPCTYLLDITPFLTPAGCNELTLTNLAAGEARRKTYTIITSVGVTILPEDSKLAQEAVRHPPQLRGSPTLRVLPGGGFAVMLNGETLSFASAFSQPGGGWNNMGAEKTASADPAWLARSSRSWRDALLARFFRNRAGKLRVHAEAAAYAVDRVIRCDHNRIHVEDRITNKTLEPIAVRFRHVWEFGDTRVPICRLGGRPGQALNNVVAPANPTLFMPLRDSAVGMVANDDVTRNQAELFYDLKDRSLGIKNDSFALDARAACTVSWSIYILPDEDYFSFINQVREDWGANFTIPGAVCWMEYRSTAAAKNPEKLKVMIESVNARYLAFWEMSTSDPVPGWDGLKAYPNGTAIFDPVFAPEIETLKKAIANIRQAAPTVKIAPYTHCFFQGLERPDDRTYEDSWITDRSGQRIKSKYHHPNHVKYQTVYPTLANSYGKRYLEIVDFYLDEVGMDWLYWDESTGPGMTASDNLSAANATYNAWDGHTAEVDPETNRIVRKYALLVLICDDFIAAVGERVRAKGGTILFNSPPCTRRRIGFPAMTESQDDIGRNYGLHLCSPLSYIPSIGDVAQMRRRLDMGVLCIKNSLGRPNQAISKCFPFTPLELREGWVKGRERIVTSRSGRFGWPGQFKARLWQFDGAGNPLNASPEIMDYADAVDIKVPDDGIAILERVEPNAKNN